MMITLHIGSWVIPVTITILGLLFLIWGAINDRKGFLPDLCAFFAIIIAGPVVLVAWIVWALLFFFK